MHTGKFSSEEDKVLIDAVRKLGKNWTMIQKKFLPNRSSWSIRERYMNYLLNLEEKELKFLPRHDELLIKISKETSKNWDLIKKELKDFSEQRLKERYYELMAMINNPRVSQEASEDR